MEKAKLYRKLKSHLHVPTDNIVFEHFVKLKYLSKSE